MNERVVRWVGGIAVASFIAGVLFSIFAPGTPTRSSIDADTYSVSAVGHNALVNLLRRLQLPVVISRTRSAEKATGGTALLIMEPVVDSDTEAKLRAMVREAQGQVVLVLPKWDGDRDHTRPSWIKKAHWRGKTSANDVLQALNLDAKLVPAGAAAWRLSAEWPGQERPLIARPQVATGSDLEPLISRGAGSLVSWASFEGRDIYLVSDPDLLNNAGLHRGNNANVVLTLLEQASTDGSFIIDETLHGYTTPPSVFRQLFEFPLVLALAQAVVVMGLLFWAGMRRFGAPTPAPVGLGRGRAVLIENTANLLQFGGHSAYTLRRYWDDVLREVRHVLHCPKDLAGEKLHAWLDRVAGTRGVDVSVTALHDRIRRASLEKASGTERLHAARAVHAWREQIMTFKK